MNVIDGLPDELLAEIFEHYTYVSESTLDDFDATGLQHLKLLLTVTSTSSRWRNIAVGTSKLWTWIVIAAYHFERGVDIGRSIIQTFLMRSGTRAICLLLSPPLDTEDTHESFMQVYELVIPHLPRCEGFCFHRVGLVISSLIFPLPGPMPRLDILVLLGDTAAFFNSHTSMTVFNEPSSLTALRDVMIIGFPMAPIPGNPIDDLSIGLENIPDMWTMPFIASSTKITTLSLLSANVLGKAPPSPVTLPNLKILDHSYNTVAPFFDAPLLEELHWSLASLDISPTDGDVYFPLLRTLYISVAQPYNHEQPLRTKLEFPQLAELVLEYAAEPSTALRVLLLPHTLGHQINALEGTKSVALPYPALQIIVIKRTNQDDLAAWRSALVLVLESYPNVRLGYDPHKTFPVDDREFWGHIRETFGHRVYESLSYVELFCNPKGGKTQSMVPHLYKGARERDNPWKTVIYKI
ncbi:hypothetical protein DL93DRAFT_2098004 [Clavulina sp. PMI_390]|nr:hypothetical protein DL93DRAFT_2098004 [Clavulina sp. PMI_390]